MELLQINQQEEKAPDGPEVSAEQLAIDAARALRAKAYRQNLLVTVKSQEEERMPYFANR